MSSKKPSATVQPENMTMEQLRLQGNACFAEDPAKAAGYYTQAVALYEAQHGKNPACTVDEFTKSAGNALTCLFKLDETEACAALATRVLQSNPILAKANAFFGRCALIDPSLDIVRVGNGSANAAALVHLCRAIYELPVLEPSVRDNVGEAITRLMKERLTVSEAFAQSQEPGVIPFHGPSGIGLKALRTLPPQIQVESLLTPFSVGVYEQVGGPRCCGECSRPIGKDATGTTAGEDDAAQQSSGSDACDGESDGHQSVPCAHCKMIVYCSEKCEAAHKAQHEQHECALMIRLAEMMEGIDARDLDAPEVFFEIAYHTITTLAGMKTKREGYDRVLTLSAHVDEVLQALHPIGPLICDLFQGKEDAHTLHQLIGVLRCNSVEVEDPSGLGVAQALHIGRSAVSYFNHSCTPNCAIDSVRQVIATTRTIAVGEELTIAYIPQLYWPTNLRRERLSEGYYFTCCCPRCQSSDKEPFEHALRKELPAARAGATGHYHPIVQVACATVRSRMVDEVSEKDAEDLRKLLAELCTHLFPFHYLCHEVRNCLSFVYAVLGRTQDCLSSCLDELLLWESLIPGALPVKKMKIQNALVCLRDLGLSDTDAAASAAPLLPHLSRLALLYDADGPL